MEYKLLLEALSYEQMQYVNKKLNGNYYYPHESHMSLYSRYPQISNHRILIPMGNSIGKYHVNEIKDHVENALASHGYGIHDYINGLASQEYTDLYGKDRIRYKKIGKILQQNNEHGLLKKFTYDPQRSHTSKDNEIIISRDKYDIAGMTSGRDWEKQSCMRLPNLIDREGGQKHQHIKDDFKNHSLVAYEIKKGDYNLEKPHARVVIKKYTSNKKINGKYHHIWRPENDVYGNSSPEFRQTIEEFCAKNFPSVDGVGYGLAKGLYNDGRNRIDPIRKGLLKQNGVTYHVDIMGELHDYVDENGNHRPAIESHNEKRYYKNGLEHRDGDEPAIITPHEQAYYKNGKFHRDGDNPAVIYNSDKKKTRIYLKFDRKHRPYGKPAHISSEEIKPNIIKKTQDYYEYGEFHRVGDLPASTERYIKNGVEVAKNLKYAIRGVLHRDGDKPANIEISKHGGWILKEYLKNGVLHRDGDKPAVINQYIDKGEDALLANPNMIGKVIRKEWLINGEHVRNNPRLPTKTISVDGNIIRKEYNHELKRFPVSIERFPDHIIKNYHRGISIAKYDDGNLVKKQSYIISNAYSPLSHIEVNHKNFKKIESNSRSIGEHTKFEHNGHNYEVLSNSLHNIAIKKDLNGKIIGAVHLPRNIYIQHYDKDTVDDFANKISSLKYDMDINTANGICANHKTHINSLLKPNQNPLYNENIKMFNKKFSTF